MKLNEINKSINENYKLCKNSKYGDSFYCMNMECDDFMQYFNDIKDIAGGYHFKLQDVQTSYATGNVSMSFGSDGKAQQDDKNQFEIFLCACLRDGVIKHFC